MADILSSIAKQTGVPLAQLKKANDAKTKASAPKISPENRLLDLIDLSSAAQNKLASNRKVDGYLQIFKTALQILNGSYRSPSNITIETALAKKPDTATNSFKIKA